MNIVRFAPSPTGSLHIGGARTCLFNWLFARSTKGKFILRIEDTDVKRSEQQYLDEIINGLKWLGMDWDELYRQSERFEIYRGHAAGLLESGKAYRDGEAIIYKISENLQIRFFDVLHGEIAVDAAQLKDQVLIKSDGSPAYNFCCVVDDALMGITHIIRGDDHIANTPKQIMLYEAMGFKVPKFCHIPMILGEDKSRMSKRHGATGIGEYKNQGYLPEALVNYLALLGWSPGGNREVFSRQTMLKEFSLKKINKTAAVFDIDKLNWINSRYIKELEPEKLTGLIIPFLREEGCIGDAIDDEAERRRITEIVKLYKTRLQTLRDLSRLAGFFWTDTVRYEPEAAEKHLKTTMDADNLEALKNVLRQNEPFDTAAIEKNVREEVARLQVPAASVIHPLRVALTGGTVSPGIFEIIALLGKEKTVKRLEEAVRKIRTRAELFDKLSGL